MPKTILRIFLIALILTGSFGCDRVTKQIAMEKLPHVRNIGLFHDIVILQYAENRGAAMSFGADFPRGLRLTLFVGIASLILFMLLALVFWQNSFSFPTVIGLSMIIGGGLGNLVDRIVNHGRVIDFIVIRLGPFQSAIFNGADMAIMGGVVILCVSMFLNSSPRKFFIS